MMLGLTRPDAGSVSFFGSTPTDAVDAGGQRHAPNRFAARSS